MLTLFLVASVLAQAGGQTPTDATTFLPQTDVESTLFPVNETSTEMNGGTDKIPLYLAGLYSLDSNLDASGLVVSSDLALKHINEDPGILSNYELRMITADSKCTDGVAIQKFFDQIFQEPTKIVVLGPSCSASAQAIASTAHFWNLNVMSPTASSPGLSNRKKYPSFFRVIPSETSLNPPFVSLMKYFGWKRVATIHQKFELFALNIDDILTRLRRNNISVITSESFDEDPTNQVLNLKKQDAKIIVASMYNWDMKRVFCEAYKQGMYGEGYVWFIPGWYRTSWYTNDNGAEDEYECTEEEITQVVESAMYIGTEERRLGEEDVATVAGITPREYLTQLKEHAQQDRFSGSTLIPQSSYGYDAVWAVALALNRTAEILEARSLEDDQERGLENFTYTDREMADLIFESMESVSYIGVSGPVSFSGSDRIGIIKIEQLQGQCPDDWVLQERFCYLFMDTAVVLDEALRSCHREGGYLVSIFSEIENRELITFASEHGTESSRWWISLEASTSGGLYWAAGPERDPLWTPWNGEKSVDVGSCFVIDSLTKSWTPAGCNDRYPFICKTEAAFSEIEVAEHDATTDEIHWFTNITWPGGVIPLDRTPEVKFTTVDIYEGIKPNVYFVSCSMALLGVILATVCLIFNIYFKNQRFVRMSSPNLNSLIIIGSILIFASTCFNGWDTPSIDETLFLRLCQIRAWMVSVGFVLGFGSMFSKTWRVHKIAALKNPKRVIITDRHLFLMVGVLLLVNVILHISWFTISPMTVQRKNLVPEMDEANLVILQPYIQFCTSRYNVYWQLTLYSYKALLLIFGVFLAWETRKVTIPALNDSKLIGICVYNVVLLSVIGAGVALALNSDPSVSFIFTTTIQIFCTAVTLVILFIPKMISVKKYPEGKTITTMRSETRLEQSENRVNEVDELRAQLEELKKQSSRYEHTGFGVWLGSMMCGCGSGIPEPTANGIESAHNKSPSTVEIDTA